MYPKPVHRYSEKLIPYEQSVRACQLKCFVQWTESSRAVGVYNVAVHNVQ